MKLRQWIGNFSSDAWSDWPEAAYKKQRYRQRLCEVQSHFRESLDTAPPGPIQVVSMCAGDGRDVISVLQSHPRRNDVTAWLVENNAQSFAYGLRRTANAGLQNRVTFLNEDATEYATYKDIVPSDILLVCGVWGHVPKNERTQLVHAIACLCKPGGAVIWTRSVLKQMARLHEIQSRFDPSTWGSARVSVTPDNKWAIVAHQHCGPARRIPERGRIFHFQRNAGK